MFFFQHPLADMAVAHRRPRVHRPAVGRLVARLRRRRATSPAVKDALRDPANLAAALGYYRATLGGVGLSGGPGRAAAAGRRGQPAPPLPTLYLHGADDGCMGAELVEPAPPSSPEGSAVEVVDGTGHFLHLERPDAVNGLILDFLGPA